MEEKEHGICEVWKELTEWSATPHTVGVVYFKQPYPTPPDVLLTASQENRPGDWVALLVSVLKVTETYLVIDFDGFKIVDGMAAFQQEVYPGAKCYWSVL